MPSLHVAYQLSASSLMAQAKRRLKIFRGLRYQQPTVQFYQKLKDAIYQQVRTELKHLDESQPQPIKKPSALESHDPEFASWRHAAQNSDSILVCCIYDMYGSSNNYIQIWQDPLFSKQHYLIPSRYVEPSLTALKMVVDEAAKLKLTQCPSLTEMAQQKKYFIATRFQVLIDELNVKSISILCRSKVRSDGVVATKESLLIRSLAAIVSQKLISGHQLALYCEGDLRAAVIQAPSCLLRTARSMTILHSVTSAQFDARAKKMTLNTVAAQQIVTLFAQKLSAERIQSRHVALFASRLDVKHINGPSNLSLATQFGAVNTIQCNGLLEGYANRLHLGSVWSEQVNLTADNLLINRMTGSKKIQLDAMKLTLGEIATPIALIKVGEKLVSQPNTFAKVTQGVRLLFLSSYKIRTPINTHNLSLVNLALQQDISVDAEIRLSGKVKISARNIDVNALIVADQVDLCAKSGTVTISGLIRSRQFAVRAKLFWHLVGCILANQGNIESVHAILNAKARFISLCIEADSISSESMRWQAYHYTFILNSIRNLIFPTHVFGNFTLILSASNEQVLQSVQMMVEGRLMVASAKSQLKILKSRLIGKQQIMLQSAGISVIKSLVASDWLVDISSINNLRIANNSSVRTQYGYIQLCSQKERCFIESSHITASGFGALTLQARAGVHTYGATVNVRLGQVNVKSPHLFLGVKTQPALDKYLLKPCAMGRQDGAPWVDTDGLVFMTKPSQLYCRQLELSSYYGHGQGCTIFLAGSKCYLNQVPQHPYWAKLVSIRGVDKSEPNLSLYTYAKPKIQWGQLYYQMENELITHVAAIIPRQSATININPGNHSGMIVGPGRINVRYQGQVNFSMPLFSIAPCGIVDFLELIPPDPFYSISPLIDKQLLNLPCPKNQYTLYQPLTPTTNLICYPLFAGLTCNGQVRIVTRGNEWMYFHLQQELERYSHVLQQHHPASLAYVSNAKDLYWAACEQGVKLARQLIETYGDYIPPVNNIINGSLDFDIPFCIFYREVKLTSTASHAWFPCSIMSDTDLRNLIRLVGSSGIVGSKVSLVGTDTEAEFSIREKVKATHGSIELIGGQHSLRYNDVKAADDFLVLNAKLDNDNATVSAKNIKVLTNEMTTNRCFPRIKNYTAIQDIELAGKHQENKGGYFRAGGSIRSVFNSSLHDTHAINGDHTTTHIKPTLIAGSDIVSNIADVSIHKATQFKAKRIIEISDRSLFLSVNDVTYTKSRTYRSSGWGPFRKRRAIETVTLGVASRGAVLDAEESVAIISQSGILLQQVTSLAGHTYLLAPDADLELLAGCSKQLSCQGQQAKSTWWQKCRVIKEHQTQYKTCQFKGQLKVHARSVMQDVVAYTHESQRLQHQIAEAFSGPINTSVLVNAYKRESETQQGPTAALALAVSAATAVVTAGVGSTLAVSLGAAQGGLVAGAMQGFVTTLASKTVLALLQHGGDIESASKSILNAKTLQQCGIAAVTQGGLQQLAQHVRLSDSVLRSIQSVELQHTVQAAMQNFVQNVIQREALPSHCDERQSYGKLFLQSLVTGAGAHLQQTMFSSLPGTLSAVEKNLISTSISHGVTQGLLRGSRGALGAVAGNIIAHAAFGHPVGERVGSPGERARQQATAELVAGIGVGMATQGSIRSMRAAMSTAGQSTAGIPNTSLVNKIKTAAIIANKRVSNPRQSQTKTGGSQTTALTNPATHLAEKADHPAARLRVLEDDMPQLDMAQPIEPDQGQLKLWQPKKKVSFEPSIMPLYSIAGLPEGNSQPAECDSKDALSNQWEFSGPSLSLLGDGTEEIRTRRIRDKNGVWRNYNYGKPGFSKSHFSKTLQALRRDGIKGEITLFDPELTLLSAERSMGTSKPLLERLAKGKAWLEDENKFIGIKMPLEAKWHSEVVYTPGKLIPKVNVGGEASGALTVYEQKFEGDGYKAQLKGNIIRGKFDVEMKMNDKDVIAGFGVLLEGKMFNIAGSYEANSRMCNNIFPVCAQPKLELDASVLNSKIRAGVGIGRTASGKCFFYHGTSISKINLPEVSVESNLSINHDWSGFRYLGNIYDWLERHRAIYEACLIEEPRNVSKMKLGMI